MAKENVFRRRCIYVSGKKKFLVLYVDRFGAVIAPVREKIYYHIDSIILNDEEAVCIDQIQNHKYEWFDRLTDTPVERERISTDKYIKIVSAISDMMMGSTININGVGMCLKSEAEEVVARVKVNKEPQEWYTLITRTANLSGYPKRAIFSHQETLEISKSTSEFVSDKYCTSLEIAQIMINNAKELI